MESERIRFLSFSIEEKSTTLQKMIILPSFYIETDIMKKGLTQKQKQFCLEYLKDFNATRAYKKIYWVSDNVARANWSRLLANADIQEYLWSKAEKKVEKAEMWVEYVLEKLQQVINIWMWEQEVELEDWNPKKVLDLSNVNSALEKLWKYHKMYTDKIEQQWNLNIEIISYKDYPDDEWAEN